MATDMASRPYIKYKPDIEKIPEREAEDVQAVADMVNVIQKAQYNQHRHCYTGISTETVDSSAAFSYTHERSRNACSNTGSCQGETHCPRRPAQTS